MSEANKREILLPNELNTELITKLTEIIEDLVKLNKLIIDVLSQHVNVEAYERMMSHILEGDDVIIE